MPRYGFLSSYCLYMELYVPSSSVQLWGCYHVGMNMMQVTRRYSAWLTLPCLPWRLKMRTLKIRMNCLDCFCMATVETGEIITFCRVALCQWILSTTFRIRDVNTVFCPSTWNLLRLLASNAFSVLSTLLAPLTDTAQVSSPCNIQLLTHAFYIETQRLVLFPIHNFNSFLFSCRLLETMY